MTQRTEYSPIDAALGGELRTRRREKKLTQRDVARHLGISFQQIQKYESGANRLPASMLYMISRILDIPIDELYPKIVEKVPTDPTLPKAHELMELYHSIPKHLRPIILTALRVLSQDGDTAESALVNRSTIGELGE
ncbi:helix-turn-helix domain-containing protein [Paracoccus aminophilus]|uniref:Transcriptional regulator, XRE family n=1 Tax=Paracoccus aminophilus JCM 7686 TaxID=1367847 RepID=S5XM56_PARAH|nr:transcriptional regulator, XRE family [Paracoccus aminophilus JCM 7686]